MLQQLLVACKDMLVELLKTVPIEQERICLGAIANSIGYGGQRWFATSFQGAASLWPKARRKPSAARRSLWRLAGE